MGALRRRRATEHQEVDTEGSWALSYGDMITLLLTFFILFFSTDTKRDRQHAMNAALIAKLEPKSQEPQAGAGGGQSPVFEQSVQQALDAKVHKVGQRLIIEFPNTSFFPLGKVELTQQGRAELKKFVDLFLPYAGNYVVSIRAYTDHKQVKQQRNRRFNDNLELSALRSVSAMRSLQSMGIPLNRMRLGGYGELRLTDEDRTRAIASTPAYKRDGLALARKVILVIEPEPKEEL